MFNTLEIKNFKSIGHAIFDLGKINVLTGQSNLGKSNVVQAIYCLTHNHWDSNYQKWGTKKCSIKLTDDNDQWVEYSHEGSSATYLLSTVDQPFTKIGRDVPVPVQEFLKMNCVQFDEDLALDFNFERQFDPSFVISLSGFELAKVFGKLMNLDIVMSAARNINKDLSALRKEIDGCEAIQNVSIEYINSHYQIELKYALLHQALKINALADEMDSKVNQLGSLISELEYYQEVSNVYSNYLNSENAKQIDSIHPPVQGLDTIICNLEMALAQRTAYQNELAKEIPVYDFDKVFGLSTSLSELLANVSLQIKYQKCLDQISVVDFDVLNGLSERNALITSYSAQENDVTTYTSALVQAEQAVVDKSNEFATFLKENNICPISGKPFAKGCVEQIMASV